MWMWIKRWAESAVEAGIADALAKRASELPKREQEAVGAVPLANEPPLPELPPADEAAAAVAKRKSK
jgi:hypothetical protein